MGPIVSATSRAGSTTVTVSRLRSRSSSGGNSEWWKERINARVLWQSVGRVPTTFPWEAVLETGQDEQLVASVLEDARPGFATPVPDDLHPALLESLSGIEALWSHQADALEAARRGHTIVTTGTASGKSLAFNLPVLDTLAGDIAARAFYLYPTKALAQDQARALARLGGRFLRHAIYDGDTPREERAAIRRRSNLILTNPDMLHVGVLPNHHGWGDVLANLAWVVVDEAHIYRGVFGSHVANVLRRLRRLARAYGAEPRFVLTSATIANPLELARRLTGLDFLLVDRDGAPRAERTTAIWNPPLVDERLGKRASALSEAAALLAGLVERDVRTICFLNSRRGVELIQRFARQRLEEAGRPELAERIAPYRAGYTPPQRREIERMLSEGELLAVVATNALELGIDVGELDAALCVTFPGTVASLRQMWGRAGRRAPGLAMYVAGEDALDQFFCRHPDEFLERPVERAILDHESEEIHLAHLAAAAYELPLTPEDGEVLGPRWEQHARRLVQLGHLRERGGRYLPRGPGYPAARIALRSASPDSVAIVDAADGELLGTVESARAHAAVHVGAVYLHMGAAYEVEELDLEQRRAVVRPFKGDWYTQPKKESETFIEQLRDHRRACEVELSFGMVSVTEQVVAYQKKRVSDHSVIDLVALDLPEQDFLTQALWYEIPDELLRRDFPLDALQGSLHAAEHGQIAVLPLLAMCDRWDIGGLSTAFHHQTARATIFIYDGHPGGVGITRAGFERFEALVDDALRLISECRCRSGCPSCVQSPKCGNLNEPLNKRGAVELLSRMAAG
jgi:DEAD/DEAH box helicase domain-containing protein